MVPLTVEQGAKKAISKIRLGVATPPTQFVSAFNESINQNLLAITAQFLHGGKMTNRGY